MRLWRITTDNYADTAFSGIGNKKVGSRWVPEGLLAVYTSESISLAVLENLVHFEPRHFNANYVLIAVTIPDDIYVNEVETDSLPGNWRSLYEDSILQAIGQDWINSSDSAILIAPSAVVPREKNYILNPLHVDFGQIVTFDPESLVLDERLLS